MLNRFIAIMRPTLIVALYLSPSVSRAAWTQLGGNAGHSGYANVAVDFSRLTPAWYAPTGADESFQLDHRGVVSDGERLYRTILHGQSVTGTYDVTAYDLSTGVKLWNFPIKSAAYDGVSQPVVSDGVVYVNRAGLQSFPGGVYDSSPSIFALNPANGALLYQSTYAGQFSSSDPPTIAGDFLFAGGGYYGGLYAYDASTGQIEWHYNIPSNNNAITLHAADENYLYLFDSVRRREDSSLVRTDAVPSGRGLYSAITNGDGALLYSTYDASGFSRGLALIEAATGELVWENTLPAGSVSGARAIGGNYVATRGGNDSEILHIVDAHTGQLLHTWQNDTWLNAYDMVLTNSHVFVHDQDRTHAISLKTGQAEWSYPMAGKLAITNGFLVISNSDGIRAFAIPEPSAHLVLAIGVAAILIAGRRFALDITSMEV